MSNVPHTYTFEKFVKIIELQVTLRNGRPLSGSQIARDIGFKTAQNVTHLRTYGQTHWLSKLTSEQRKSLAEWNAKFIY